jgi:membrane associated rhomboid family serine protease
MADLPTSWSDPLHQVALRAMIRAECSPYRVTADETHWIVDDARSAIVVYVAGRSAAAIETLVREHVANFPRGGLDFVFVGGDDGVRDAMKRGLEGVTKRAVGLAHVNGEGKLWTERTHGAIEASLEAMLANGVPGADPVEAIGEEMSRAHEAARVRLEALREFARRVKGPPAYATIALIAALVVIFACEWMFGKASVPTLVRMGGCVADRVKHGEPWRVLSSALLHANVVHILFNSISLFSLGGLYERLIGRGRYLTLFVAAAIGAGIASTIATPNAVMIGASGGIFGLLGASAAIALKPRDLIPADVMPRFRRDVWGNLLLMVVYSLKSGVSWPAHLGGGIVGFVLMITGVIAPDVSKPDSRRGWKIPGAIAVALLVASFALALAKGRPWAPTHAVWQRQALPGTTLSAELPGPLHVQARHDTVKEFLAGDINEDGFVVSVLVQSVDPLETEADRMQAAEQIRAREGGLAHPEDTQPAGSPQITTIDGFPVVAQDATASNGSRFRNFVQVRAHTVVSVQMVSREDAPSGVDDVPRRVLDSITGEP